MYSPKSSSVAGILGIVLGAFGAHDWYLGNRQKQARRHLILTISGILLYIVVMILRAIASSGQAPETVTLINNIASILYTLAWLVIMGSIIWGVVDGVLILAQGDAGLKARGYFIQNDPDNPLSHALSTTTVRQQQGVNPGHTPTTRSVAPPRSPVSLPNTPTLEQQGSNAQRPPQPIVFRSSDIHQTFQFSNVFEDAEKAAQGQVIALPDSAPTSNQPAQVPSATNSPSPVAAANVPAGATVPASAHQPVSSTPPASYPQPINPAQTAAQPQATPQASGYAQDSNPPQVQAPYPHPMRGHAAIKQAVGTKTIKDVATKVKRKFAFNPVVTRRIIISISVMLVVVVAGFIIKGVLESTVTTGYQSAYRTAKELSPVIASLKQTPNCQYVNDYLGDTTVAPATYDTYLNGCKDTLTLLEPLIIKLGEAPAISWDSNLSGSYQEFRRIYDETLPTNSDSAKMVQDLNIYKAWHDYLVAVSQLSVNSPDAAANQAADILKNSGHEALVNYVEEWLSRELSLLAAARRYAESVPSDPSHDPLRREMEQKQAELQAWVQEHQPDLVAIAPIAAPDLKSLSRSFDSLYERIKRAYAQNYVSGSGDCDDRTGKVYCD